MKEQLVIFSSNLKSEECVASDKGRFNLVLFDMTLKEKQEITFFHRKKEIND